MHYSIPVIMITGQAQADARDLALQKVALGFLQKPFSEQSLLELSTLPGEHDGKRRTQDG
jgi:FixJ family two-component response regulator